MSTEYWTPQSSHRDTFCSIYLVNNYYGLQMASHSKEVALVAESIRCLGQETEQYEVCSPEFNLK